MKVIHVAFLLTMSLDCGLFAATLPADAATVQITAETLHDKIRRVILSDGVGSQKRAPTWRSAWI